MDDTDLRKFLEAGFAFLCTRKLGDLVSANDAMKIIEDLRDEGRLAKAWARFVVPTRKRVWARLRQSDAKLAAWLPESARQALSELLDKPVPIPRPLIMRLVSSKWLRTQARTILEEVFQEFLAGSLPTADKGVLGVLSRSAQAAAARGRGLLSGLGGDVQKAFEERLRDLVNAAAARVEKRLLDELTSARASRAASATLSSLFGELMELREKELVAFIDERLLALIDALIPGVIHHDLCRAEVLSVVADELRELASSDVPLGVLLEELGVLPAARKAFVERGLVLGKAFLASPEYGQLASQEPPCEE